MQYMSLYQSCWLLYEGLMELMESVKIAAIIVLDLKNGKASCMCRVTLLYDSSVLSQGWSLRCRVCVCVF